MTTHAAKKDLAGRLSKFGVTYSKMIARTVSFTDLARESRVFIRVENPVWPPCVDAMVIQMNIPVPRAYIVNYRTTKVK